MVNNKKCPISVDCWTTLLSDKILNVEMKLFTFTNLCIVAVIAFLGGAITINLSSAIAFLDSRILLTIFLILSVVVGIINVVGRNYFLARLKPLEDIRGKIISGELDTPDKIREQCLIKRLCLDV
jgi:ABC-type siderophore export system fused ATPase/permease subunit